MSDLVLIVDCFEKIRQAKFKINFSVHAFSRSGCRTYNHGDNVMITAFSLFSMSSMLKQYKHGCPKEKCSATDLCGQWLKR